MTSTDISLNSKNWFSLGWRLLARGGSKGWLATIKRAGFLLYEAYRDRRLNVKTRGFIHWHELGDNPNNVDYEPIGYRTLDRALNQIDLQTFENDVFLDYGCGKGRVVVTAAERNFSRVIGVEFSATLCGEATENIDAAAARLHCSNIVIENSNAEEFELPDDVTVVFMFNPFTGTVLQETLKQIEASLDRSDRDLTILYVLPVGQDDLLDKQTWLARTSDQNSQGLRLAKYQHTKK